MTKIVDKEYLVQVCRQRFRGAKAEAAAIAAERRSEFKAFLKERYSIVEGDSPHGQLHKLATFAAAETNAKIASRAEEFGIEVQFRPSLVIDYGQWEEFAQQCSQEDAWLGERRI